jgi:prophage regulatory protein
MDFIETLMTKPIYFKRKPYVLNRFDFSKSTLANKINEGSFVPPCPLGQRAVAWISYEIDAIAGAMAAGQNKEQLRELVTGLIEQRQQILTGSK